jgi:hypothetical protein
MNKKVTTAKRNTTKAKTTAKTPDATGATVDTLQGEPYTSDREIPIKSVFDRWTEAAQKETCKDKIIIHGAKVLVCEIFSEGKKPHTWTLRGDAVITFRPRTGGDRGGLWIEGETPQYGYITTATLADPSANKTLRFDDNDVLFNCLQNPEKPIFGAFEWPEVITILDGNPTAKTEFLADNPGRDPFRQYGSVHNCTLSDGATVGTPPCDPKQLEIKTPKGELIVKKYGNLEIKREASKGSPAIIVDNSQKGVDTIRKCFIQYSIPNGPAWENLRTLFFNHAFSEDKALPLKNPWRGLNGGYRKFIDAYARMTTGTPHKWWIETK